MNFRDFFKKWRSGDDVEAEVSIDFSRPGVWLFLLVIILLVVWLIR